MGNAERVGPGRRFLALTAAAIVPMMAASLVVTAPMAGAVPSGAPTTPMVDGVSVTAIRWLTPHRVALDVHSPAMGTGVQVQLLLPRDWNARPDATFPSLYMLDGLRAREDENGWTLETNAGHFFADKNALIVLPVGGESSFYSDWNAPDKGKNYKWETFLLNELPPVLRSGWRTNGTTGIAGLSMGGTAAVNLAQARPELFEFVASYSGYLDTTSFGMPEAISYAMTDAGGYSSTAMWGPPRSEQWNAHDPKQHVEKLRDKAVYISSGSGNTGPHDRPSPLPGIPENHAGFGLEVLARMTSQTYVNRAREAGIRNLQVEFRNAGTHSWPYWQFEMTQSWPLAARALRTEESTSCSVKGAIAVAVDHLGFLAGCSTEEYPVEGGVGQDFRGGQMFWSAGTGAHELHGAIGGLYAGLGGPRSGLGLPTSDELGTPDGRGRYNHFERGSIYWTPQTGAHSVRGAIRDAWAADGWEGGRLGYPRSEEIRVGAGFRQDFENGTMYWSPATGAHWVIGKIGEAYAAAGGPEGPLGFPTSNENGLRGGAFSAFARGNIYWSPTAGAHPIPYGAIFDAWGREGYENGRLGYPVSGVEDIPAGGRKVRFERGEIREVNGRIEVAG